MRVKAVINPESGQKSMRAAVSEALGLLKARGLLEDGDIITRSPSERAGFYDGCGLVVAAGGDGTLHDLINDMKRRGADIPVAYLPTGTMNDFGTSLGLPRSARAFCDMIEAGKIRELDLGKAGDQYFHYVVAGGAMSSVSYATARRLKYIFGRRAYYISALPRFFELFKGSKIKISGDAGEFSEKTLLFLIANSSIIAGFRKMFPEASPDDGLLDVLVIRKVTALKSLPLLLSIVRGTHLERPEVLYFRTKRVEITQLGRRAVRTDIDGERGGPLPLTAEIVPGALKLIVP